MAQHVYLVRHGETALNADGRLRGLADPELNETGEAQARAVALALANIDAVIRPLLARIAVDLAAPSVPTGSYQVLKY